MTIVAAARTELIADGDATSDADHQFALPTAGGTLYHVSIRIGGNGPAFVGASVLQQGDQAIVDFLGDREWVRGAPATEENEVYDVYHWDGALPFKPLSLIKIFVDNNSGSTVVWKARWVTGVEVVS